MFSLFEVFYVPLHRIMYFKIITHQRHSIVAMVATVLALLHSGNTSAQVMDTRRQVDTLSLSDRIAVRTNMVGWTLMIPNVGVELDLGRTNWSRYAINLNLRYRPKTNQTYAKPVTFAMTEARIEARQYWRVRQAEAYGTLSRHTNLFDKLMSCRRMVPHHPRTTYYRGIYVAFDDYSILIPKVYSLGRQGQQISAGFTWGFVRPLYAFPNGNSLDLECGISAGMGITNDDSFYYDKVKGENITSWNRGWRFMYTPVLNDLRVGFVYRFGKYPIQKKYRWRYDVDLAYRAMKDAAYFKSDSIKWQRHQNDSLYKVANAEFRHLYDSIVAVHAVETQEKINRQAKDYQEVLDAKGGPVKEKTRAQKAREKARRKQETN